MANYRVIGTPVERVDGPEMLSGQALYGPDVKLPGMLWGKILRSPVPHGKVLRVDVEKAKKHPGVKAVICAPRTCRRADMAMRLKTNIFLPSIKCTMSANLSQRWRPSMRIPRKRRCP